MKSLAQIREQYLKQLSSQYSVQEIDMIFFTLAESYLHRDKTILKLGLHELMEETEIKSLSFQNSLFQLMEGVPYQYVVGDTLFYGCEILVNPEVLIPRPETEELVEWILKDIKNKEESMHIADLCSGSGCIGIALAKKLPQAEVLGLEISEKAIEVSKKNAIINQVKVSYSKADLLEAEDMLFNSKFDVIVSNPPYIREYEKEAMEDRVLKYEPSQALFVSNENPLVFYQKIINFALKNLKPTGKVYVEINQELGKETQQLFLKYFSIVELKQDLSGNFRMIKAEVIA